MPAQNTPTCPAVVPLCGTKVEVPVPSLDDWEKEWEARPKARMENGGLKTEGGLQKLVAVDFRGPVVAVAEAN